MLLPGLQILLPRLVFLPKLVSCLTKFLLPSQNLCFPFLVVALCAIAACQRFAIHFCYFGFVLHLSSKVLEPEKFPVSKDAGAVVDFWMSLSGKSCSIKLLKSWNFRMLPYTLLDTWVGLGCREVLPHKEGRMWSRIWGSVGFQFSPCHNSGHGSQSGFTCEI